MAIRLNQRAVEHTQNLIKGRQYEIRQRLERGATFRRRGEQGYRRRRLGAFAKWHLAYDTEASEETKSRYKFLYGDVNKLHRSALIAAKQRAGSERLQRRPNRRRQAVREAARRGRSVEGSAQGTTYAVTKEP
jgi:hypothetical protein